MKMKNKIICIVGESGCGKTTLANYLEDEHGIKPIKSRTTRPPRKEGERGHTFVSKEEFDEYDWSEMIAYTTYGDYEYCCLMSDVTDDYMTYVIDERGLLYLKLTYSHIFDIFVVRMFAPNYLRKKYTDKERMLRDEDMFTLSEEHFDYFIENDYRINVLKSKADRLVETIYKAQAHTMSDIS